MTVRVSVAKDGSPRVLKPHGARTLGRLQRRLEDDWREARSGTDPAGGDEARHEPSWWRDEALGGHEALGLPGPPLNQ